MGHLKGHSLQVLLDKTEQNMDILLQYLNSLLPHHLLFFDLPSLSLNRRSEDEVGL